MVGCGTDQWNGQKDCAEYLKVSHCEGGFYFRSFFAPLLLLFLLIKISIVSSRVAQQSVLWFDTCGDEPAIFQRARGNGVALSIAVVVNGPLESINHVWGSIDDNR